MPLNSTTSLPIAEVTSPSSKSNLTETPRAASSVRNRTRTLHLQSGTKMTIGPRCTDATSKSAGRRSAANSTAPRPLGSGPTKNSPRARVRNVRREPHMRRASDDRLKVPLAGCELPDGHRSISTRAAPPSSIPGQAPSSGAANAVRRDEKLGKGSCEERWHRSTLRGSRTTSKESFAPWPGRAVSRRSGIEHLLPVGTRWEAR